MSYKQAIEWLKEARAVILFSPSDVTIKMPGRAAITGPDFMSVFQATKKNDEDLFGLGFEREKHKVIYIKEKTK